MLTLESMRAQFATDYRLMRQTYGSSTLPNDEAYLGAGNSTKRKQRDYDLYEPPAKKPHLLVKEGAAKSMATKTAQSFTAVEPATRNTRSGVQQPMPTISLCKSVNDPTAITIYCSQNMSQTNVQWQMFFGDKLRYCTDFTHLFARTYYFRLSELGREKYNNSRTSALSDIGHVLQANFMPSTEQARSKYAIVVKPILPAASSFFRIVRTMASSTAGLQSPPPHPPPPQQRALTSSLNVTNELNAKMARVDICTLINWFDNNIDNPAIRANGLHNGFPVQLLDQGRLNHLKLAVQYYIAD